MRLSEKLSDSIHLYEHILESRMPSLKHDEFPPRYQEYPSKMTRETLGKQSLETRHIMTEPSATISSPTYTYYTGKPPVPHAPPLSSSIHSNPPSETSDASSLHPPTDSSYMNYPIQIGTHMTNNQPSYYASGEDQIPPIPQTGYLPPFYPPYPFHGYPPYPPGPGYQPHPYFGYTIAPGFSPYPLQSLSVNEESLRTLNRQDDRLNSQASDNRIEQRGPSSSSSSTDHPPLIDL